MAQPQLSSDARLRALRSRGYVHHVVVRDRSKYRPHQGKRECARRLRQTAERV